MDLEESNVVIFLLALIWYVDTYFWDLTIKWVSCQQH